MSIEPISLENLDNSAGSEQEINIIVRAISSTSEGIAIILWEDFFGSVEPKWDKDGIPFINNGSLPDSLKLDDWIVVRAIYDKQKRVYRIISFVENVSPYLL